VLAARGNLERLCECGTFEPEIQKAGAGNFDLLANFRNIQFCQNIGFSFRALASTISALLW